jgi:hypothetical protein
MDPKDPTRATAATDLGDLPSDRADQDDESVRLAIEIIRARKLVRNARDRSVMSDDQLLEILDEFVEAPAGAKAFLQSKPFRRRWDFWLRVGDKRKLKRVNAVQQRLARLPAGRTGKHSPANVREAYRSTLTALKPLCAILRARRNAASVMERVRTQYPVLFTRLAQAGLTPQWFSGGHEAARRSDMAAELVGCELGLTAATVLKYAQAKNPKESRRN